MKPLLTSIFALLVLVSCQQHGAETTASAKRKDTVDSSKVIVPGKSIGRIALGDSAQTVVKLLGKPGFSDAAMGKSWSRWYSDDRNDSTCIYFTTDMGSDAEFPKTRLIRITSPVYVLAGRYHTGMKWDEIKPAYPSAVKAAVYTDNDADVVIYENRLADIAFDVNSAGTCVAITVHAKDIGTPQLYQVLHPEMKAMFNP